ncbi:MAG: ribonuclease R [candidate division Zixibacteria bacterium]|nr:ribonuclease R [candidate division Zixibacteria bacterium]
MSIETHFIIDYLSYKAKRPLKIKELASELRISSKDYPSFRRLVKQLLDEGKLVNLRRGRIGVPSELNLVVGEISISKTGIGTLISESGESIVVPAPNLSTALDGDKVMVRVGGTVENQLSGKVIKVLERSQKNIVGIFHHGKHFHFVEPDKKRIHRDIYIPKALSKNAQDGERVVVRITEWDEPYRNPEGEVVERLGVPGKPGVDLLTVIKTYNLPDEFPSEVMAEAEKVGVWFNDKEMSRRRDFSKEVIYTIDPFDARDFDDAVTVSKTDKGYRLGVFIADVSHFVRDDTALDREAFNRGNSVYLPGKVIPMLPEQLSNDLCSLKPNRRRLAYAVLMNFARNGKMLDWEIVEAVIKSRARLTYEDVQEYFNTGEITPHLKRVAANLTVARELAQVLLKCRMQEGSLDFDLPEAKVVLNKAGEVIELGSRVRLESHRLVEEFMLAANRAVALDVFRKGHKFLYRVHDRPDMEKLEAFSLLVGRLGYKFPVSPNMKPLQFSRFLDKIKGRPEEELLNELMLRSMKKAVYQPRDIGHFGLAFTHYTHFTSPIRRYPDLMVHRLLKILAKGRYPANLDKRLDGILSNVGYHCSDSERTAEAAERDAIKIKQVQFMARRVGDRYEGVISGVLSFGFFVRLHDTGVEGMVRLSSLDDDYYHFDESNYRLVGRRTGRVFRLGDPVSVGVLSVDPVRSEIDLFLVDEMKAKPEGRRKSRDKKRGSRRKR